MPYQTMMKTPFGFLGIQCDASAITGIDFLSEAPSVAKMTEEGHDLMNKIHQTIEQYLIQPHAPLEIPINVVRGTPFQRQVWAALCQIPTGVTLTYGDLAKKLGSGPRAVANACGANPIPLLIPCHRVVAAKGIGGFMKGKTEQSLNIKRWLLNHERSASGTA